MARNKTSSYDASKDKTLLEEKICDSGSTEVWGQVHKYNGGPPKITITRWYGDNIRKLGRMTIEEAKQIASWINFSVVGQEERFKDAKE